MNPGDSTTHYEYGKTQRCGNRDNNLMSNNRNVVAQILFVLEKRETEMDGKPAYHLTHVMPIRAKPVGSCVYPGAWIIPLQLLLRDRVH